LEKREVGVEGRKLLLEKKDKRGFVSGFPVMWKEERTKRMWKQKKKKD